jgi:hypothetical protein
MVSFQRGDHERRKSPDRHRPAAGAGSCTSRPARGRTSPAAHHYEAVWNAPGGGILFDARNTFHYLAVKDDKIYLIKEEVE